MFVSDRSFFMRDPARSLYSTGTYYLSVMTVNAAVTIINAAILVLIMYGMIGECPPYPLLRARMRSCAALHSIDWAKLRQLQKHVWTDSLSVQPASTC